jgi:hypothetical protein
MPDSLRSSITRRRYRLAQASTVAGSLAVGALVVDRLVSAFRDDFFLFYGVTSTQFDQLRASTDAQLPLTLGQLMVAVIALLTVCVFVWSERRRLRQGCDIDFACRRSRATVVQERLSFSNLYDEFVTRTSLFAGVLLTIWLVQSCLERWLGGMGWNIEYADWRSLLPLASVFGLCVLAGMLVAGVSLVGLRVIHVLELALRQVARRRWRRASAARRPAHWTIHAARTLRELIGCDILSRPPPVAC